MAITGLGGIGGIFSGLDTDTLVRQLMSIERRPAVLMENRRHLYELRKELWSEVNGALLALRAKAEAFLDPYAVNRKKVSSSDETAVVARVGDHGQALVGRYDISVTRLATAHKVWGTAMGAGWTYGGSAAETFQVSDGTVTVSVTVNPGDDLLDIARSINDARDGSGRKADVQATVIGDVLYLQRGMTGAGNVMTFTDSTNGILKTLGILNATGSIANQSVPQDAQFSVNGLSFVRSQNTGLTDVIAGLSIDLRKEGVAAALTVEQDVQAGVDAIRAFVDQYNAVIDLVNTRLSEKPEPNAVTDTALRKGLLRGDTTLVNIKSRLRTTMTQNYGSLSLYKDLSQIGIRTDSADFGKSGKLVVDEAKLREALTSNPDQVAVLFFKDVNGNGRVDTGDQGLAAEAIRYIDSLTSTRTVTAGSAVVREGILPARMDELDRTIKMYTERIEAFDRRLAQVEENLRRQFTQLEMALSMNQAQLAALSGSFARLMGGAQQR